MESTAEFVGTLREWAKVFMHRSMGSLLVFARKQGLSMSQMGALYHISRSGTSSVSEIGDDLGVTSAAASQMLERLVQNGLVTRGEDPHDRRAKQIVLTESGRETIRNSMEAQQRWFAALADSMSAEERELAISSLRTLTARRGELDRTEGDCWLGTTVGPSPAPSR